MASLAAASVNEFAQGASGSIQPFLKWPGGKRWLTPILAPALRERLSNRYFEPFLGSGAMYLGLDPDEATLSDINAELIETIDTITREPERVIEAVWRFSNTAECYYRVRSSKPRTPIGTAARFLYLNRTAWGGVHRLNRRGEFNTPFGNSGRVICRRKSVIGAAKRFAKAQLVACDFAQMVGQAGLGDVVYADPPYVGPNSGHKHFKRYTRNGFDWGDQKRLAIALREAAERGATVAVSGRASLEIASLYPDWQILEVARACRMSRDPGARGSFDEIVVLSFGSESFPRALTLSQSRP